MPTLGSRSTGIAHVGHTSLVFRRPSLVKLTGMARCALARTLTLMLVVIAATHLARRNIAAPSRNNALMAVSHAPCAAGRRSDGARREIRPLPVESISTRDMVAAVVVAPVRWNSSTARARPQRLSGRRCR